MHNRTLQHLRTRHQKLDHELHAEAARKVPDLARIARLKKLKLRVKDAMMGFGRPPEDGPKYA